MRRVRLTFISEFDWWADELTQQHMDEIVEMFLENPDGWIAPAGIDEQTFVSVDDITEES